VHFSWENLEAVSNRLRDLQVGSKVSHNYWLPLPWKTCRLSWLTFWPMTKVLRHQALANISQVSAQLLAVRIPKGMVDHFEIMLKNDDTLMSVSVQPAKGKALIKASRSSAHKQGGLNPMIADYATN